MQHTETLLQMIASAAEATGFPVEIDRPAAIRPSEFPAVLITSGMLFADQQTPQTWARHWSYSPMAEIFVVAPTPAEARAQLAAALDAFVGALDAAVEQNRRSIQATLLLTPGTAPGMTVTPIEVDGDSRVRGYQIDFNLQFMR